MSPDFQLRFEDEMVADLVGHLYKNDMTRPASQEAGPPVVNLHWPRWAQRSLVHKCFFDFNFDSAEFAINGNT